ncbi:long-chain fatty acid-CoA ligase [Chytridiales sp. JEL 0842]|nr:long-chain fatty acid-CoA ligase [Chytridiales sp. JEL 0842]
MLALIAWILVGILFPVFLFRTRLGRPRAWRVGEPANPNEGAPRRSVLSKELLTNPEPSIKTLYDILERGNRLNPNRIILGARHLVRIVEEEKLVTKVVAGVETKETKKWRFFELSKYEWYNYRETFDIVHTQGSGLRALGLKAGDKLTIFAATSRDWLMMALTCFTQNLTVTTAYDTLGEEGLTYSLNECEVTTLFTNADLLPMVHKITPKVSTLKNVIYNGEATPAVLEKLKSTYPHLKVLNLEALRAMGTLQPADPVKPAPEDLACIMYTSGSTGVPKGVMLSHSNIVAGVTGGRCLLTGIITSEEYYLGYLPLAHILEFTVEFTCLYEGIAIGYGSVRTLTDASVRNCLGDIRELRPTVMAGVPAVWESIRKGVISKLRETNKQKIFDFVFELKWLFITLGLPTGIFDAIVFNKIKAQTGGRLKIALSGGAPLPKSTQKFLTVCVCPVVSGYGLTECCAILSIQSPQQIEKLGVVGAPLPSGEVKLVDVPDTTYSSRNRPRPQGEVWLRGGTVMKGYYKQPQLTAETLTEDGWLMTGDIGEWLPDGNLVIIDRKKNLVKLANGEYIALEKLESVYKTSPYVQNICVYGDSEQPYCVALVQPVEKEVVYYCKANNLFRDPENMELSDLVAHPEVSKAVVESLKEVAKKVDLKPAEIVQAVFVAGEEWTPQNGLLTAAMKLKRKDLVKHYMPQIDKMYLKK